MEKKESPSGAELKWLPLIPGTLIKRYKRFLADVCLENGRVETAHCPNSGSMLACCEPGRTVYLSRHDKKERKLRYTWELIQMPPSLVGINTLIPNRLTKLAAAQGAISELGSFDRVRSEVAYSQNSRIDLLLEKGDRKCYLEVKNCTLVDDGVAYFPDAVTERGRKHLMALQQAVSEGQRAVMFFLVQRTDAKRFRPADHIDPAYGSELRKAARNGVEILVYDVEMDLQSIRLGRSLPFEI